MTIVDENDRTGFPGGRTACAPVDGDAGADAPAETEDVVRPGDGHLSGIESLCVGESQ